MKHGFSIIEVVLAAGLFVILASGSVVLFISGWDNTRLGNEQTIATQFASEGLESTRSNRNAAYTNLINSVTSSTFEKYTRTLTISDVQRDGSGNIVASGGTLDANTKKIVSDVAWTVSGSRNDSVSLTEYLTNWKAGLGTAALRGGVMLYGNGTTTPRFRTYDTTNNNFTAETATLTNTSGLSFMLRTSPTRQEAVSGHVNSAGVLQIMCYDGSTWTNDWSTTVGGTATTRRFDIAYESNSGDVVVLYSTNVATTNELATRTKPGTLGCGSANWSATANFDPLRTSGVVQWVKLAGDKRSSSNLIAAIWADANADLSAAVWSGTVWGNEPSTVSEASLEVVTAAQDVDDFDVDYESLSGDIMVVWANSAGNNGTNGVRYRTCTGGTSACIWNAVTTPPTFADDATNLDLAANPNTDEMVFASVGNAGSDLQVGYWSGSAWTNTANRDTAAATPLAGTKLVAAGWLISAATTRSVIAYNDAAATNIGWVVGSGSTFTLQTDFVPTPVFGNPQKWYDIQMDPFNTDRLQFSLADVNRDLFSKRLIMTATPAFTWSNSDGAAALQLTLGQALASPFAFAFWRKP